MVNPTLIGIVIIVVIIFITFIVLYVGNSDAGKAADVLIGDKIEEEVKVQEADKSGDRQCLLKYGLDAKAGVDGKCYTCTNNYQFNADLLTCGMEQLPVGVGCDPLNPEENCWECPAGSVVFNGVCTHPIMVDPLISNKLTCEDQYKDDDKYSYVWPGDNLFNTDCWGCPAGTTRGILGTCVSDEKYPTNIDMSSSILACPDGYTPLGVLQLTMTCEKGEPATLQRSGNSLEGGRGECPADHDYKFGNCYQCPDESHYNIFAVNDDTRCASDWIFGGFKPAINVHNLPTCSEEYTDGYSWAGMAADGSCWTCPEGMERSGTLSFDDPMACHIKVPSLYKEITYDVRIRSGTGVGESYELCPDGTISFGNQCWSCPEGTSGGLIGLTGQIPDQCIGVGNTKAKTWDRQTTATEVGTWIQKNIEGLDNYW